MLIVEMQEGNIKSLSMLKQFAVVHNWEEPFMLIAGETFDCSRFAE